VVLRDTSGFSLRGLQARLLRASTFSGTLAQGKGSKLASCRLNAPGAEGDLVQGGIHLKGSYACSTFAFSSAFVMMMCS
jgi:hypothetical protein